MTPRQLLSPQSRAALFDPPTDPAAIVRHYTFSPEDLALIRRRRRAANRLGFAVHLAYLRFPGRVIGADESPPTDMLYLSSLNNSASSQRCSIEYASRDETRREHLGELQAYLGIRPFRREDYRAAAEAALGRGDRHGSRRCHCCCDHRPFAQTKHLASCIVTLEKIGLAARARARKRAHKNLIEGLERRNDCRTGGVACSRRRSGPNAARMVA